MRWGPVLGGLLLATPALVSCGGGDDSSSTGIDVSRGPAPVSVETFCAAAETFENTFAGLDSSNFASEVKVFKAAAQALEDAGTPDGIPDDAHEGLTLTLDKIIGLPDDAQESDMNAIFEFTDDEKAKSMAFETYLDDTCDYRGSEGASPGAEGSPSS